jgi:hypothetical protein
MAVNSFKDVMNVHVQYDVYLYNLISMMIVEMLLSQCSYWLKFGSPFYRLIQQSNLPLGQSE